MHIPLAVEALGFEDQEVLDGRFEGTIDGVVVATGSPFVYPRCNRATGTLQAFDLRLVYDDEPSALDQALTEVSLTLTDADGRSASTTHTYTIDASETP